MEIKLSLPQVKKIKAISQKYEVIFVVVFGSAVKGTKRGPESDFDLAVLTSKKPSYQLFKNLFSEFSEVFKGENVDLRFLNEADPFFRFQVVKEGKLLYGHPQAYTDFKVYTLKIFLDDGRKYFPYLERLLEKNQKTLEAKVYDWQKINLREFLLLVELKILPQKFAEEISQSVGLRNILVHQYRKLDEKIFYNSIKDCLAEYTQYCRSLLEYLKKN